MNGDLWSLLKDSSFWFSIRGILALLAGIFAGLATYHSIELAFGRILIRGLKNVWMRGAIRWAPTLTVGVLVFIMFCSGGGGQGLGTGGGQDQGRQISKKTEIIRPRWIIRVLGEGSLKDRLGEFADPKRCYFPLEVAGVTKREPVTLEEVTNWFDTPGQSVGDLIITLELGDPNELTLVVRRLEDVAKSKGWTSAIQKIDEPRKP